MVPVPTRRKPLKLPFAASAEAGPRADAWPPSYRGTREIAPRSPDCAVALRTRDFDSLTGRMRNRACNPSLSARFRWHLSPRPSSRSRPAIQVVFGSRRIRIVLRCSQQYHRRCLSAAKGLLVSVVLAGACARLAPAGEEPHRSSSGALDIAGVQVRLLDAGISVHYQTSTSVRDCGAQATEMPRLWAQFVKPRLSEPSVKRVVLFPEDTSGQSVSIEFTKGTSSNWSAKVPCAILIPE